MGLKKGIITGIFLKVLQDLKRYVRNNGPLSLRGASRRPVLLAHFVVARNDGVLDCFTREVDVRNDVVLH